MGVEDAAIRSLLISIIPYRPQFTCSPYLALLYIAHLCMSIRGVRGKISDRRDQIAVLRVSAPGYRPAVRCLLLTNYRQHYGQPSHSIVWAEARAPRPHMRLLRFQRASVRDAHTVLPGWARRGR